MTDCVNVVSKITTIKLFMHMTCHDKCICKQSTEVHNGYYASSGGGELLSVRQVKCPVDAQCYDLSGQFSLHLHVLNE